MSVLGKKGQGMAVSMSQENWSFRAMGPQVMP
jgi:hypothetical protein